MTIFTVKFDVDTSDVWTRLLNVFKASIKRHMPETRIVECKIDKPAYNSSRPNNATYNTEKLKLWKRYMDVADDNTIFADCDMLALHSAAGAFDTDFDIGMTFRPVNSQPPMNGGIVFARPTKQAREFFEMWLEINDKMYADPPFHHKWRNRYLGMNQAAFGHMWETGMCDHIRTQIFPTRIWNAVNQDWKYIDNETVFVHIKSELRRAVLNNVAPYGVYARPLKAWYQIEKELIGETPKNNHCIC
jgi:hypothetical protein